MNGNVYVYLYVILYFNKRDNNFQYVTQFADSFQLIKSHTPVQYKWDHDELNLGNDKNRYQVIIGQKC